MKIFKYLFWIILCAFVVTEVAHVISSQNLVNFETFEEHEKFLSNERFFGALTMYVIIAAFLNFIFGGVASITRGIRNRTSRHKDIPVGIILIFLPVILWFCFLLVTSGQNV